MKFMKNYKIHLYLFLIIVCLIFITKSKDLASFYGFYIYPFFSNNLSRISNILPFSLFEIILYILILILLYALIKIIVYIYQKKEIDFKKLLSKSILFIEMVYISFMLLCGINYHRHSFVEMIELKDIESNKENLIHTIEQIIEEIPDISNISYQQPNLNDKCREAMNYLSTIYPWLEGYYPKVKPVLFSNGLSHLTITGIFTPWTMEANYNKDIPIEEIPFNLCHELSHLRGFMQEEEANFIAYLACHHSNDPFIKYSGEMQALSYLLNELYRQASIEEYKKIYEKIPEFVKNDYKDQYAYWSSYDTILSDIHESINDAYLKANDQELGQASYRYFVQLLIDYYGESYVN